jgi:uncharacterized protein YoxC
MSDVTTDTIKSDVEALQAATAAAVEKINQLGSGIQVTQEQLDNLHAAITQATSDLTNAVASAP